MTMSGERTGRTIGVRRVCAWAALLSVQIGMVIPLPAQTVYTVFSPHPDQGDNAGQPTGKTGRNTPVTVTVQDSTIKFVVNEIAKQAHLRPFFFNDAILARRVSVHIVNMAAMDALRVALQGTGLEAKVLSDGETVSIHQRSGSSEGRAAVLPMGVIAGRVTDSASGSGLRGASVRVAGTKINTVTSDSGNFRLHNVPAGEQVLTVRLFGYKPVERTVTVVDSQLTAVHIVMASVPTVLSGVVTTAAGVQRKVEVGNDITTLNVDSIMRVAPIQNVTDLLESRVPGLTVQHSDGVPGDPSRIRIRGVGSIQLNNDPIVIVDGIRVYSAQSDPRNQNLASTVVANGGGVSGGIGMQSYNAPSPLDQIDPNTIATIEVLKGPSATATYGSDAANGVIVITTKHGHTGPTTWNLAMGTGVNWLPGSWPKNFYRFGTDSIYNVNGATEFCQWYTVNCRLDSLVAFQALDDPRYTVFSHGSDQTVALTIAGGSPTLTYSLTGSGSNDLGNLKLPGIIQQQYDSAYGSIPKYLVRPDNLTMWGVSGQLAVHPARDLQITLQSSLSTSSQQQSSLNAAISQLDGIYVDPARLDTIPLIVNEMERVTDNQQMSTNAAALHWQPLSWLPLDANVGFNTIQRVDESYVPFGINACGPSQGTYASAGAFSGCDTSGSYGLGRGISHNQTLNVGTTIPFPRVALAIGGNLFSESTTDFSVYTNQLAPGVKDPTTFYFNNGNTVEPSLSSQETSSQSTYGIYIAPQLHVLGNLYLNPGFRLDGGSGGSSITNSGVGGLSAFPKIDLSYLAVDRQNQRPLWGMLTQLRPRLAFGFAGTQPGPAYKLRLFTNNNPCVGGNCYILRVPGNTSLTTGGCGNTLDGTTIVNVVCLDALGNTQLRPERSSELVGGFDLTLWNGRASLQYTQYNKTRHDAILGIPIAPSISTGSTQFTTDKNIGEIRNTGTELTGTVVLVQQSAMSWNVNANLSNDNNLVVRLNKGQLPIVLNSGSGIQTRVEAGYPLFGTFARPITSYIDSNHDGVIEPNEIRYGDSVVYIGQPNPKYQFNLSTDLALLSGRLSFHAAFAYQNGLTQINAGACTSGAFELLPNSPNTPLATQAAVVAAGCVPNTAAYQIPTQIGLAQIVNTLRFQNLSINYVVPRSLSQWFRVPTMTVALQGDNLGLHTNYRGVDPNVNAFSTASAGDQTEDSGQIPEPRTWWLRVTMGSF